MIKTIPIPGNSHLLAIISLLFGIIWLCIPNLSMAFDISLIDVEELQQNLTKYKTLLDARPRTEYEKAHLPGAIPFSWEDYTETDAKGIKYRIWPPQRLAEALSHLGIQENTPVVVYGDADKSWGGEAWVCWMLAWLGHTGQIRLLNGGIQAWKQANLALETGPFTNKRPQAQGYKVQLNSSINISAEAIRQERDVNLVDVRSNMEWFMGHIPNAVHIPWESFYKGPNRTLVSRQEFQELLKKHGLSPEKRTIYYCTGGIRSAWAWLAHILAGYSSAINFEGGIEEWNKTR